MLYRIFCCNECFYKERSLYKTSELLDLNQIIFFKKCEALHKKFLNKKMTEKVSLSPLNNKGVELDW